MICPNCFQEHDTTACPDWARRAPSVRRRIPVLTDAQEARVHELIREEVTPHIRARIELGELETDAELKIRKIVREEMTKRFGWEPRIEEFFGEEEP
jgi:hypothetical protein